jgi:hypothetical protein
MIRCDAKIVIAGTVDHNAGGKNDEQHNRRKPHSACIHPKVELSWQLRFGALFPLIFVHWALHFRGGTQNLCIGIACGNAGKRKTALCVAANSTARLPVRVTSRHRDSPERCLLYLRNRTSADYNASRNSHRAAAPRRSGLMVRAPLHWEAENPHCFCSISICFVMRVAFCA